MSTLYAWEKFYWAQRGAELNRITHHLTVSKSSSGAILLPLCWLPTIARWGQIQEITRLERYNLQSSVAKRDPFFRVEPANLGWVGSGGPSRSKNGSNCCFCAYNCALGANLRNYKTWTGVTTNLELFPFCLSTVNDNLLTWNKEWRNVKHDW